MIGHFGGVPLEETLLPLVSGAGAGLLIARVWIASRLRRVGRAVRADLSNSDPAWHRER